mgnify:FL=1
MPTDWIPYDPLPARNIPVKIVVEDEAGDITRGWAKEGNTISLCGANISGFRPFFVIQVAENSFVAAGTDLMVKTEHSADFRLVDYTVDGKNPSLELLFCSEKNSASGRNHHPTGWVARYALGSGNLKITYQTKTKNPIYTERKECYHENFSI